MASASLVTQVHSCFSRRSWWAFLKTVQTIRLHRNPSVNSSVLRHQRCLSRTLTTTTDDKYIVRSPYPDIDIPDRSFTEFMLTKYKEFGDLTAVKDIPSGKSYSFKDLQDVTVRVASGLTRLGVKKGDRVLIFSTNCPEYLILFLACGAIGAVVSTANPAYTPGEISRQLEHSGSSYVVTLPGFLQAVKDAIDKSPVLKQKFKKVIVLGDADGCLPFRKLMEDDGKAFPDNVDVKSDDVFVLPYSSGTTGLPKGVMLSHKNIISNILQINVALPYTAGVDKLLGVLPFFHIYGMVASQLCVTYQGAAILTIPKFVPQEFLTAIQEHKITFLHLVPPLLLFLAKDPNVSNYDISSVHTIICGAAPLGEELCKQLAQRTSANIRQAYGLTETSPALSIDVEPARKHTVGPLVPNTEAKIVDVTSRKTLPSQEVGEICIRGPQVMLGYLDNKQATDDMIKDGWLQTGDIGHFDEDARLVVTDRLKELIKYKGFQVPPAELESVLLSHPGIQDVAVLGVPDQEAGEVPKAFVVLKPGENLTPKNVMDFVKENVAPYKQLRGGVTFIDQIPKTPSGKILRRQLK